MLLIWDLYWPAIFAALAIGVVTGVFAYRKRTSLLPTIAIGIVATLAAMALWHGAAGTAERFRANVETAARTTLDHYEMHQVAARLGSGALSRTLVLSGPADDFQREELVRIMNGLHGVSNVRWANARRSAFELPLLVGVELWAIAAFGLGLLLSHLVELRRRARVEWRW